MVVDDLANFDDVLFKHAMRRGISYHQGCKSIPMPFRLHSQIAQVNVALRITGHRDHMETSHRRRRGIGAVSRSWNQANVASTFSLLTLICANRQQARVLALGARIW